MKIVQAHTGARAVPVPDEGVILVDPDIGHDTAVNAIQAALPGAHPDAVEHWVEAVLPTVDPLTEVLSPAQVRQARQFYRPSRPVDLKPGRHRVNRSRPSLSKPARIAARTGAFALTGILGAALSPLLTGGPTPAEAESAWSEPTFSTLSSAGVGWNCDTSGQLAHCISDEGIPTTVEVLNGASVRTFNFRYDDPATQQKHRADLKVFSSDEAEQEWVTYQSAHRPNLVRGKGWVAYGTDAKRIDKYTKILKAKQK